MTEVDENMNEQYCHIPYQLQCHNYDDGYHHQQQQQDQLQQQKQQYQHAKRKQQHCMRFLLINIFVLCLFCWILVVKQQEYSYDNNHEHQKNDLKPSTYHQKKSENIQQHQQQHQHQQHQQQHQQQHDDYPTKETKTIVEVHQRKQQTNLQTESRKSENSMDRMMISSSMNKPIVTRKLQRVDRSHRKLILPVDYDDAATNTSNTTTNILDRIKSININYGVERKQTEVITFTNSTEDDALSYFMYRITYIESMIEQTTAAFSNIDESAVIGAIPILMNGTEMDDIYKVTNISSHDIFEQNQDLISFGTLYIMIQPPPTIIQSSIVLDLDGELLISPNSTIRSVIPNQLRDKSKLDGAGDNNEIRIPSIGNKTLGIIRISTNDSLPTYDAQTLYDGMFNVSGINLKTQYEKCSFGQLIWNPLDIGIIEVYVNESISKFKAGSELVKVALNQLTLYGTDTMPPIANFNMIADKVLIVVPPGTGGWVANSGMNFWRAQFNDKWSLSLSALMHELGHTIGLSHSNENGIRYDDRTSYMSAAHASSIFPQKCFNGVQNYQLQWYKERHRTLSIEQLLYKSFLVNVATFVDYDKTTSTETVILNIANVLFLQYNMAKDFNIGTEEKKNQTTITTNADGGSNLLGGLSVGDQFHVYLNIDINYFNNVNHHERERRMNDVAISLGNYSSDYSELSHLDSNNNNNDNNNNHTTAFDHFLRSVPRLKPDRDINSETSSDNNITDNNGNNISNTDNNGNNNNDTITTGTKSILLTIQACEVKYGRRGAEIMVISVSLKNEIICHQTEQPTPSPSYSPTMYPSSIPTVLPSLSSEPTFHPTGLPSNSPTTLPTSQPTLSPSHMPTRSSLPSIQPTIHPSIVASDNPSKTPTSDPTQLPTISRTRVPSTYPSNIPSNLHSSNPSQIPTYVRSGVPSLAKSNGPSQVLSNSPSDQPSDYPTTILSQIPSRVPSSIPSILPSDFPSNTPTLVHSDTPSVSHSSTPTKAPSSNPTIIPTLVHSDTPSASYSNIPTKAPSSTPSILHYIGFPSIMPTLVHSDTPSAFHSNNPTTTPNASPSTTPTAVISSRPSDVPTIRPSAIWSKGPSMLPTKHPITMPSAIPSAQSFLMPSLSSSNIPSEVTLSLSDKPTFQLIAAPSLFSTYVDLENRPTPALSSFTNSEFKDLMIYIASSNHANSQNVNHSKTIESERKKLPRLPYMFQIKKLFEKRNDDPSDQYDYKNTKRFKYKYPKFYTTQDNDGENTTATGFLFESLFNKNQYKKYEDMNSINKQSEQNAIKDEMTDGKRS